MKTSNSFKLYLLLILSTFTFSISNAQIPTEGLIGYYTFDGHAADSSDLGHDGIIVDNVGPFFDRFGNPEGALVFSGGFVDLGNPAHFQSTEALSIALWIKPRVLNDWQAIVTKWNNFGSDGYYLGINPQGDLIRWNIDVSNPIDSEKIFVNQWIHLAITHDGSTSKLYLDGTLVEERIFNKIITDNSANVLIGSQNNIPFDYTFVGVMDEVLFYNRAIEQEEITDLFNFIPTTSITHIEKAQTPITLFPNPVEDFLYLKSDSHLNQVNYTIMDTQGKQLLNGNFEQNQANLSALNTGIYFMLLEIEGVSYSKKIFVK